jgi:hypothetical protein
LMMHWTVMAWSAVSSRMYLIVVFPIHSVINLFLSVQVKAFLAMVFGWYVLSWKLTVINL